MLLCRQTALIASGFVLCLWQADQNILLDVLLRHGAAIATDRSTEVPTHPTPALCMSQPSPSLALNVRPH